MCVILKSSVLYLSLCIELGLTWLFAFRVRVLDVWRNEVY